MFRGLSRIGATASPTKTRSHGTHRSTLLLVVFLASGAGWPHRPGAGDERIIEVDYRNNASAITTSTPSTTS
jgi:hypothetical protein